MLDAELAALAARHYRALRGLGITLRKTPDLIIGTFCIARGHALLHDRRGFDSMERRLGCASSHPGRRPPLLTPSSANADPPIPSYQLP